MGLTLFSVMAAELYFKVHSAATTKVLLIGFKGFVFFNVFVNVFLSYMYFVCICISNACAFGCAKQSAASKDFYNFDCMFQCNCLFCF